MSKKIIGFLCAAVMMTSSLSVSAAEMKVSGDIAFNQLVNSDEAKFSKEEIAAFSETEPDDMILVNREVEDLGDGYFAVVEDYEEMPSFARAANKIVEKTRHWYVKNGSTVKVQFSLHGKFAYNGKQSACTAAWVNVYNNDSANYAVTSGERAYRDGIYAGVNCGVRNKNTGKTFSKALKIGVRPDGSVVKP